MKENVSGVFLWTQCRVVKCDGRQCCCSSNVTCLGSLTPSTESVYCMAHDPCCCSNWMFLALVCV